MWLQAGEDAVRFLIVAGHEEGGADGRGGQGGVRVDAERLAARQKADGAAEGIGEGEGDPREEDDEQHQNRVFEVGQPAHVEHLVHLVGGKAGQRDGPAEHEGAADDKRCAEPRPGPDLLRSATEILRRHGEGRFGRQSGLRGLARGRPGVR